MSLNKPAAGDGPPQRWSGKGRWYLWDGGFLALGRSEGIVPPHEHHAIQIVLAVEGTIGIRGAEAGIRGAEGGIRGAEAGIRGAEGGIRGAEGEWRMSSGFIVRPDVVHSYDANGAVAAMLFVDPESTEGVWLTTSLREAITIVPDARVAHCTAQVRAFLERPLESLEVGALVRHCVHGLCAGAPPSRRLDERVGKVLAAIRQSDDLRVSVEDAAAMVYLSPSRFAHLFKQQVGLPFRRYMLWRKLTRAMLLIGRGGSISTAAHAADFADAAHLTRTFHQMFAIPPSVMMRGEFFELPSPFDFSAPPSQRR